MKHRIEPAGDKLYKGISSDEKTMILIAGAADMGPRGGVGDTFWEVVLYRWEEPDDYNETGSWDGGDLMGQPHYLKDAKRVARKCLARAEDSIARAKKPRKTTYV